MLGPGSCISRVGAARRRRRGLSRLPAVGSCAVAAAVGERVRDPEHQRAENDHFHDDSCSTDAPTSNKYPSSTLGSSRRAFDGGSPT